MFPSATSIGPHFVILACPFRHGLVESKRKEQLTLLANRWRPWWSRQEDRQLARSLDDTYFLLPHARTLLFPETDHLPEGDAASALQQARQMASLSAEQLSGELPSDGVLRLTWDSQSLQPLRNITLTAPGPDSHDEPFRAELHCEWIDAVVFPQHVGFLLLKIRVREQTISPDRLSELLYHVRLIHPPAVGWNMPRWHTDGTETEFSAQDLVDFLLEGLAEGTERPRSWQQFLSQPRRAPGRARYSSTPFGNVFGEAFHLYTYACFAGDSPNAAVASTEPAARQATARCFSSPEQQMLFELAACIDTTDPDYQPHPDYVQRLFADSHIGFWQGWEGLALEKNVVFLGMNSEGYAGRVLGHNVESDYLALYLLALYQKCRLSVMFGELVRRDQDLGQNLREVRRLFRDFIRFQNAYWYCEPTRKPLAKQIYQKFQAGLGVAELFDEIGGKVRQLQEFYESRFQRRISSVLNLFTFIAVPAGVAIQLYWMLSGGRHANEASLEKYILGLVATLAAGYLVAGALWLAWMRFRRD